MNNLQAKLALLKKVSGGPGGAPQGSTTLKTGSRDQTDVRLRETLNGDFEETPRGRIFVVRNRYSLSEPYGHTVLSESLGFPAHILSSLYQGLEDFEMERSLFFDTETTGLAGGSGTYAFLVGLGYYQGEEFVTEQLLMRDHSDEPALLWYFAQRLRDKTSLVSFNGRTFDAQLLSTRYLMHRLQEPFEDRSHLDLLHISRRIWNFSRLPDCRLETLETRVVGAPRHDDVPGWMIPDLFFDFLRSRNPGPLKGVIEHNRRDLLAMVALCSKLNHLLNCQEPPGDPHLCLGLARVWAHLEDWSRSDSFFRYAVTHRHLNEQAKEKGMIYWSRELKKRRESEKAALLWRRILTHYPGNLEATVELAKWLEHKRRDYRSALILVEGGLRDRTLTSVRRRELEHRASRLRRRVGGE